MGARDGSGCLAELDAYDRLDPWSAGPSTSVTSSMAMTRAMCLMLAGQCDAGKTLYRAAMQNSGGAMQGPEMLERSVDAVAGMYCQGSALSPRDELLRALMDLNQGAYMTTKTPGACKAAYDAALRLMPVVQPQGLDDTMVKQGPDIVRMAGPGCLGRAGDCGAAWSAFRSEWLKKVPSMDEATLHKTFESVVPSCPHP
jgi:hypothetical protein